MNSRTSSPRSEVWYDARLIGVNKLDGMMKVISRAAELSKAYTNHSVRATAITLWSNAGVQNCHIMAISGHRSEQSLAHYNTRPSTSQLQQWSDVLSRSLNARKFLFFWQSDKRQHPNSRTQRDDNGNVKQLSWIALQQLHGTTSTCARHFGLRFQPRTLTWVFYFYLDLSCKSSTHFWHESAFKMHSLRV